MRHIVLLQSQANSTFFSFQSRVTSETPRACDLNKKVLFRRTVAVIECCSNGFFCIWHFLDSAVSLRADWQFFNLCHLFEIQPLTHAIEMSLPDTVWWQWLRGTTRRERRSTAFKHTWNRRFQRRERCNPSIDAFKLDASAAWQWSRKPDCQFIDNRPGSFEVCHRVIQPVILGDQRKFEWTLAEGYRC